MLFSDRLVQQIKNKRSHVIVGLDPNYSDLPKCVRKGSVTTLRKVGKAISEFNRVLIDAIFDLVPAVKPQIAFYERYGIEGIKAFIETVGYAKERGLIVVEDAKKNDIGSTATAYSEGHIGKVTVNGHSFPVFDVDAITVNPYLGTDSMLPFLREAKDNGKAIFVLVKTSNPSSTDLQDLEVIVLGRKMRLYERVAALVNDWGRETVGQSHYSSVGAVVGATFPRDAKILRKAMPHTYFLVPGYGVQGGKAEDVVHCFNKDGYGALVAASRSINYAYKYSTEYKDNEFAEAAREAVRTMNNEINGQLQKLKRLHFH
jgi:orotidine-5'-phosphate decarboxylase